MPVTGRYAIQGRQMTVGLTLWSHRAGASLLLEDDQSRPQRAVEIFERAQGGGFDILLGPYGSDSVRTVASAFPDRLIWNHGAAANDTQRLPNVISLPSPSSRYLVALARAVAQLRPGGSVAVVTAAGRFGNYAWNGLTAEANDINLTITGPYSFSSYSELRDNNAILTIGPVEKEVALFRQLVERNPKLLLGGVSPGLSDFPQALGADPEGFLAPVQWHLDLGQSPALGPSSAQVLEDARLLGLAPIDYVAAQAYGAAVIAAECHRQHPSDPGKAARELRTSTFYGDFGLDPNTGEQRGHQMSVVQWRRGRQELIAAR